MAEALRRHPCGVVVPFGQNIVDAEQTVRLVSDLQSGDS